MLFLVTQEHSPETCPQREGRAPESLFDHAADVVVRFAVADVPGHKLYFLVESDSYDALQNFLEPGRTSCTTNASPVRDLTAGTESAGVG